MTEPTKTEGDDIGLPDQPSKPQDYETSSVQAAQPPQTATDPDKYRKLKSKFSMLRKEYLKILQNWEESNQRVTQLTQERKFLREKLQHFLRSRQFHGKVSDEDLALSLLACSQSTSTVGVSQSSLQVEQLLSLVQLAQQKQSNLKPIQVSSKAHKNALLQQQAAAAAQEISVLTNGTSEFAKPGPTTSAAKSANTVIIQQKQTNGTTPTSSNVTFSGKQAPSTNGSTVQFNSVDLTGTDDQVTTSGNQLEETFAANLAQHGQTANAFYNGVAGQNGAATQEISKQQVAQYLQQQKLIESNGVGASVVDFLTQQAQANAAKGKKEQDLIHLNGGGATTSKRQKIVYQQDQQQQQPKSSVKIRLNAKSNLQQKPGVAALQAGTILQGGVLPANFSEILTLQQQQAILFQHQQQSQGAVQTTTTKKPRKRSVKSQNAQLTKQQAALSTGSIQVVAGNGQKPQTHTVANNVSITLPGIHVPIDNHLNQAQVQAQQQTQQPMWAMQVGGDQMVTNGVRVPPPHEEKKPQPQITTTASDVNIPQVVQQQQQAMLHQMQQAEQQPPQQATPMPQQNHQVQMQQIVGKPGGPPINCVQSAVLPVAPLNNNMNRAASYSGNLGGSETVAQPSSAEPLSLMDQLTQPQQPGGNSVSGIRHLAMNNGNLNGGQILQYNGGSQSQAPPQPHHQHIQHQGGQQVVQDNTITDASLFNGVHHQHHQPKAQFQQQTTTQATSHYPQN